MKSSLPFERLAVPLAQVGCGVIRALAELAQGSSGRFGLANVIVHQKKFIELLVIEGGIGPGARLFEALRLGNRIGIERGIFDVAATRPKTYAAGFMGVGFARHGVGAGAFGSTLARKAGHGQIEAPPKEMDRTAFPNEARPELVEDRVDRQQNAPEFLDR